MDRTGSLRRGTQATHRGVPQGSSTRPRLLQLGKSEAIVDAGQPDAIAVELKRAVLDGGLKQPDGRGRQPREVQQDRRGGELLRLGIALRHKAVGPDRRH